MAVWPINKLLDVFKTIDNQLRDGRNESELLRTELDEMSGVQDKLQGNYESLRKEYIEMRIQDNHGYESMEKSVKLVSQDIRNTEKDYNAKLDGLTEANKELNEKYNAGFESLVKTDKELNEKYNVGFESLAESDENLKESITLAADSAKDKISNLQKQQDEIAEDFKLHCADKRNDHWNYRFGTDSLISNLQLAAVEQVAAGNRHRLEALKGTHSGEKCVIIGNGPSLKAKDLDVLKHKNIYTFASKRINLIFDQTEWRPDFWGISDLDFIKLYSEEMSNLKGFVKVAPCQTIINMGLPIKDAIYFPFIQMNREPCWFNKDVTRGVHFWGTITIKLINFAMYMGFTEIYLLGVDNTVPIKTSANGTKYLDLTSNSHFTDKYYDKPEDFSFAAQNIDDIEASLQYTNRAYKDISYYCNESGVTIYNATRGGELEAFPRVSFDRVFGK